MVSTLLRSESQHDTDKLVDIFLQWAGYVYLGLCFPLRMVSGGLEIKAHHPWELRHSLARVVIVPPWESRHPLINCTVFPSGLVGGGLKSKPATLLGR